MTRRRRVRLESRSWAARRTWRWPLPVCRSVSSSSSVDSRCGAFLVRDPPFTPCLNCAARVSSFVYARVLALACALSRVRSALLTPPLAMVSARHRLTQAPHARCALAFSRRRRLSQVSPPTCLRASFLNYAPP
eukprot:1987483-Rhodomonas_salina.1